MQTSWVSCFVLGLAACAPSNGAPDVSIDSASIDGAGDGFGAMDRAIDGADTDAAALADGGTARDADADDVAVMPDGEGPVDGGAALDALLATLPVGAWKALPNTAMRMVCPSPLSTGRCDTVQSAWSGAAYDDRRDRLVLFGGGHGDSFYNQLFAFDLGAMRWTRLTEMPADATPSRASAAMEYVPIESCGYYPTSVPSIAMADLSGGYVRHELCARADIAALLDTQQPRSSHTYSKLFYDRASDRFCYLGGGYYPSAQTMSRYGFCYDFGTGRWEQTPDRPPSVNGRGSVAADARGHQWYLSDDVGPIGEYAPETRTWSTFGSVNYDAVGTSDVDRRRNKLWLMRDASRMGAPVYRYDLADRARLAMSRGAPDALTPAGTAPTRGTRVGFVYADPHDRFFYWSGGRDVFALDPSAEQWSRLETSGDDPGPALNNGTYGRLRFSRRFNVLVLVNGAARDVHVLRLPPP